nr:MAG TPA: hypothetical protein [Siphoviridae sp. cttZS1]
MSPLSGQSACGGVVRSSPKVGALLRGNTTEDAAWN